METKATQNKENYVNVERIHLIVKTYISIPLYDRLRCFAILISSNMRQLILCKTFGNLLSMDQVIVFAYQVARKVVATSSNDTTCETRVA